MQEFIVARKLGSRRGSSMSKFMRRDHSHVQTNPLPTPGFSLKGSVSLSFLNITGGVGLGERKGPIVLKLIHSKRYSLNPSRRIKIFN